jgi:hypothetical protein
VFVLVSICSNHCWAIVGATLEAELYVIDIKHHTYTPVTFTNIEEMAYYQYLFFNNNQTVDDLVYIIIGMQNNLTKANIRVRLKLDSSAEVSLDESLFNNNQVRVKLKTLHGDLYYISRDGVILKNNAIFGLMSEGAISEFMTIVKGLFGIIDKRFIENVGND